MQGIYPDCEIKVNVVIIMPIMRFSFYGFVKANLCACCVRVTNYKITRLLRVKRPTGFCGLYSYIANGIEVQDSQEDKPHSRNLMIMATKVTFFSLSNSIFQFLY